MSRIVVPADVVKPASAYAQGIVHALSGERLLISGQIGMTVDGRIVEGLEAQMEQAWRNLLGVLGAAGFERKHLVRVLVTMTAPADVALYRAVRDRMLEGHLCAMTFIVVAGLAHPDLKFEVEGEAVKES